MKKMLRRIAVLVCVATLSILPASSVLAASNLTLVDRTADSVSYAYQPDPYYIYSGGGTILLNDYVADDLFHVDPWTEFTIGVSLKYYSTYYMTVFNVNTGQVVYQGQTSAYGSSVSFYNNSSSEAAYRVHLSAITDLYVGSYSAHY